MESITITDCLAVVGAVWLLKVAIKSFLDSIPGGD